MFTPTEFPAMPAFDFVHWMEDDAHLGYLADHPDHGTQGDTFDDLVAHLEDLHADLVGGHVPGVVVE